MCVCLEVQTTTTENCLMIQSDHNVVSLAAVFSITMHLKSFFVVVVVVVCKFLLINLLHQRLMLLIRIVVNE